MAENSCERTSYNDWDEYYMAIALLSARQSKDPVLKVGACIVSDDKKIVGIGYNDMPMGCDNKFQWISGSLCHAELNAVLNKTASDVKNCIMYVTLFPCNECAKVIIQSGIKTVIYMSDEKADKLHTRAAKDLFDAAKIEYRQYISKNKKIEIDFSDNWSEMNQCTSTKQRKLEH